MFEFTTQTVYNALKFAKTEDIRKKTAEKGYNIIIGGTDENPELRIGNIRFNKDIVLDIQVKNPTPENLAKVTFDIAKLKELVTADGQDTFAGSYRVALYIGLSMNSQDSFYANDYVYKGKPLYIEFPVTASDTPALVAKRIKKIADKYTLFVAQEKIFNITVDGTKVAFEAVNGYQLIKKAVVQKFQEAPCGGCDKEGYLDIITGVPVEWTADDEGVVTPGTKTLDADGLRDLEDNEVAIEPGLEAFGDYNWIIHNLRLPTLANTYFWSATKSEMPVVGATYKQYIIRICKERDGIAGEVVGQRATSVTTHVLYVNTTDTKGITDLETELKKLATFKTDADDVLKKPYDNAPSAETTEP